MTDDVAIVFLAAGTASRMRGGDKQLEEVDGVPLLRRLVTFGIMTKAPVYVTLSHADHPRFATIHDLAVTPIIVPDATLGMSRSLRAAATQVTTDDHSAMLVCPTDMPDLDQGHFDRMIDAWREHPDMIIVAADHSGRMGHPVIFPKAFFKDLETLTGDTGAKSILRAAQPYVVDFADSAPTTDLDTPEAWAAWRTSRP